MIRFSVKALVQRKLRTVLTALAIVLGVAMVSGTYVLTDSIDKAFDAIAGETYKDTDAVITGKTEFVTTDSAVAPVATVAESLLATVRDLPEVREATGVVNGQALLIGADRKVIATDGGPSLGFSVDPSTTAFQSLTLATGSWPTGNQVVIDEASAAKHGLVVGQPLGVQSRGPVTNITISGIVRFDAVSTIGGATLAGFDLPTAQRLFDKVGRLDTIQLAAADGVDQQQLLDRVRSLLPAGAEVRSGDEQVAKDAEGTDEFIGFLQNFLLVFGGIALFVGSFVIANSLSITIAQRTREFATLRTLGASRRQVLGAVILEALVIGFVASLVGLFAGLGLAKGMFELFETAGAALPNSGLVFRPRTVVIALLVGVLVTLVASLRPALRATRVAPIAAVREGAVLKPGRFHRFRAVGALALAVLGFGALLWGLFDDGLDTTPLLLMMLLGAVLVFVGVAMFASRIVRPLSIGAGPVARWSVVLFSVVVWPLFSLPYWLLRYGAWGPGPAGRRTGAVVAGAVLNPVLGVLVLAMAARRRFTGWQPEWPLEFPTVLAERSATRIGSENSQRDPQRTASTAAALMIGLALVTLVSTIAVGLIKPFENAVDRIFTSDYAITAQDNFTALPVTVAEAVAAVPGVTAVGGVREGAVRVFDDETFLSAVDPTAPQVLTLDWVQGSQEIFGRLGADGAVVDKGFAEDHGLGLGSTLSIDTPSGRSIPLVVKGIFEPPAGGSPFGPVTIAGETFDKYYEQPQNLYTFVRMDGGVTPANTATLRTALEDFPNAKPVTREEFKDAQVAGISSILNILYVLLGLSVVVSLFGIVNTLVLTVFERTRELGMLRAVGMTRRQIRRMIRHESVIIALIGAVLGIVLGLVLAGLLIARVEFLQFVLPVAQLVAFAVVAVFVGIFAAIFPARRAARLNPLEALQYE